MAENISLNTLLRYFFPVLFFIPLNFFTFVGGIGYGIQWPFFRYQVTSLGDSVIPLARDLFYVTSGLITGKSIIFYIFPVFSAMVLFIAFLFAMANRTKISGFLTIASGLISLVSSIVQYGITFHGAMGTCIPFGSLLFLIFGMLLLVLEPDPLAENLLKKYDYLILLIGVFLVFCSWSTPFFTNDTLGSQLLPYSIIENHSVFLDNYPDYINYGFAGFRFYDIGNGHYVSVFPIVTPVLISPLYAIPFLLHIPHDGLTQQVMTHVSSALICALAVMVIYLTSRFFSGRKPALLSALVFAFATDTWTISSQTLYAHGMSELLLATMIFLVFRNEKQQSLWNFIFLGICSALFFFNRPSDSLLLLPVIAYLVWYHREKIGYYAGAGILFALPFIGYNLLCFHNVLGGYSMSISRLSLDPVIISNFFGLLISPNKGLFIFSPVLILSLIGFWSIMKSQRSACRFLQWSVIAMILTVIVYATFDDWGGGETFGPRYLICLLPYLVIGLCIFFASMIKKPRNKLIIAAVAVLVIFSVFVQFIGMFYVPEYHNSEETWYNQWSSYNPWDTSDLILVNSLFHKNAKPVLRNDNGTWLNAIDKEQCTMSGTLQLFQNDPDRYELLCGMKYPSS
jgi:hypothetical protein